MPSGPTTSFEADALFLLGRKLFKLLGRQMELFSLLTLSALCSLFCPKS
jgi:hypothetical protein